MCNHFTLALAIIWSTKNTTLFSDDVLLLDFQLHLETYWYINTSGLLNSTFSSQIHLLTLSCALIYPNLLPASTGSTPVMPNSNLLTVVGGTGTQGLSLINAALEDGSYKIRAVTRSPTTQSKRARRQRCGYCPSRHQR